MMNKNKNKVMYLDLTENEIKQYVEGGYIVEEDGPGDPPGTSYVNPFRQNPIQLNSNSLFSQDELNKSINDVNETVYKRQQLSAFRGDQIDAAQRTIDERRNRKPKKKGAKYENIKPTEEGLLPFQWEDQSTKALKNFFKNYNVPPNIQREAYNDPLKFLRENTDSYPVYDEKSGLVTVYNKYDIAKRIYDYGLSPRKVAEDLGIGTKYQIEDDFAATYIDWERDYSYDIKTRLNDLMNKNYSKEQAIAKLVNDGKGDVQGVTKLFNTELNTLEATYEAKRFDALNIAEREKYIKNLKDNGYSNNSQLKEQQEILIGKYDANVAKQKELEFELKQAKENAKKMLQAEQDYARMMGNVDLETGGLSYTYKENQGREWAMTLQTLDSYDQVGYVNEDMVMNSPKLANISGEEHLNKEFATEFIRANIRRDILGAPWARNKNWKNASEEKIQEEINKRLKQRTKSGQINLSSRKWVNAFVKGKGNYRPDGVKLERANWIQNKKEDGDISIVEDEIDMLKEQDPMGMNNEIQARINNLNSGLTKMKDHQKLKVGPIKTKGESEKVIGFNVDRDPFTGGVMGVTEQKTQVDNAENWKMNPLNPRYEGEASIGEKILNWSDWTNYAISGEKMQSNYGDWTKIQDKRRELGLETDFMADRVDNNTVSSLLNLAGSFTGPGLVLEGVKAAQNAGEHIDAIKNNGILSKEGGLAALQLATIPLGAVAGRNVIKKGITNYSPVGKFDKLDDISAISTDLNKVTIDKFNKANQKLGLLGKTDELLSKTPIVKSVYNPTKSLVKELGEMDGITNLPGANFMKDVNMAYDIGSDLIKNKNVQKGLTGLSLTYAPNQVESAIDNYQKKNYTGVAKDVLGLGLAFTPGFAFKNFGSTAKSGYDILKRGIGYEGQNLYKGIKGLSKFRGRQGNLLNKTLGYGSDLAKAGYHGSVLYYTPDALTGGYKLLTDKDATTSEKFQNAAKFTSILPGVAGASNLKYAAGAGFQFASDPTDEQNWLDAGLTYGLGRPGITRYGTRFFGKQDESKDLFENTIEDGAQSTRNTTEQKLKNAEAINETEVENNEVENNEVEDIKEVEDVNEVIKKKKKKKKKQKTVRRIRGKKIFEDGGEIDESVELFLDTNEIQKYILGGFVVEEI